MTTSVSFYAENVLRHHALPYDKLIAYHDSTPHKPSRHPIDLCLAHFGKSPDEALAVGDSAIDYDAYSSAGVTAWGAGWSTALVRTVTWAHIASDPDEILGAL